MKIPNRLNLADIQEFARDVTQEFDKLTTRNIDLHRRRIINAGKSELPFDYVTRIELDELKGAVETNTNTVTTITSTAPSGALSPAALTGTIIANQVVIGTGVNKVGGDADLTFATDTLTATKIVGSTSITDSGLTAGRVTFAGAAGLLSDDADMTFATDTLTVKKIILTDLLLPATPSTATAPIRLVTGSAPTAPVDGDIWREDNTNTGLKIQINGVTKTIVVI